jgi:sortase A
MKGKPYVWLYLIGLAMILYYGYEWGSQIVHAQVTEKTQKVAVHQPTTAPPKRKNITASDLYPESLQVGQEIGTLTLPRINASLRIVHGSDEEELEKGVGHYAKSVLPGEPDLCVLAGHRDTVFHRLGEIRIGDPLIVQTVAGTFTYRDREIQIVDKNDPNVIHSTYPHPRLLVSTCYPFHFIGPAPKRYLLIADLEKQELNTR